VIAVVNVVKSLESTRKEGHLRLQYIKLFSPVLKLVEVFEDEKQRIVIRSFVQKKGIEVLFIDAFNNGREFVVQIQKILR